MPPRALPSPTAATRPRTRLRAIDFQDRDQRNASPLEMGLIELPTRPRSEYTMGIRKAAIQETDQGRLREAADLTLAAMTESGYARGILADLTHGLWGLPKHFIGREDMIADLDDTPERVGQFRVMFPEADVIRLMSWGFTLGVGVGQMRKKYDAAAGEAYPVSREEADAGPLPPKIVRPIGAHDTRVLRTWSPKYLRNQWWDETWWLMTADGEIRITPDDGEWLLYMPHGPTKPWEFGAWKSLTAAFVLQRDALFDRSRHSEVLAPVRVGKVPAGTTETQRQKFLKLMREMKRMGIYVLPPGLDYAVVESTGRVAQIYDAIIAWGEREFAMMSGAITTATGSPGFSKGDVQERFTRAILSSLGNSLSACLHGGGLRGWAIENYGTADAPRAEIDTAAPEDKKANAETLKVAAEGLGAMTEALAGLDRKLSDASVQKFMQGLGFETEQLPVRTPHPKVEIVPTDRKFAYTLDEIRAGDGWPDIGDERGNMTPADAEALAKKKAQATPAPSTDGETDEPIAPGDAPTDEAATALASKMTTYGVERCAHERPNRCRLCGVERLRDFTADPDGSIRWHVAWRPIVRGAAPPPPPTPATNGAHPPAWQMPGGDA